MQIQLGPVDVSPEPKSPSGAGECALAEGTAKHQGDKQVGAVSKQHGIRGHGGMGYKKDHPEYTTIGMGKEARTAL